MIVVDPYSPCSIIVQASFQKTLLAQGTAFCWETNGEVLLLTDWHNASGRNPNNGKHLSPTAAEPDRFLVWWCGQDLAQKAAGWLDLYDSSGNPRWFVHPAAGSTVDVVAIPLPSDRPETIDPNASCRTYPINTLQESKLMVGVGMDVFVIGYPFGNHQSGYPVWKRASIASEPNLANANGTYFLVDTASRPGMSGSPVISRSHGAHPMEDGNTFVNGQPATKFIGIYSGRLATADERDAQLGIVWPAHFLKEIIAARKLDKR